MRKKLGGAILALFCIMLVLVTSRKKQADDSYRVVGIITNENTEVGEKDGYDGAFDREQWEYERVRDPRTGKVYTDKIWSALKQTQEFRSQNGYSSLGVVWTERGPIYDSVGPSNGNGRGGGTGFTGAYTSGRIRAVLVDPVDPTGNTVWTGGVNGGLWKTTNFLSADPNWVKVNDFFPNMAISSICVNPFNTNIMYFATGEPTNNSDRVLGKGVFKSTDHGAT
jgi:trimeric autotransporter adhesin